MRNIVLGSEHATLECKIGGGNEGDVYSLKGDPSRAVKIYNYDKRQSRAEKIRAIVTANFGQTRSLIAFPLQVATSNSGEFLGFSMRLMSGRREIHQLYNPKSRLHHYPDVDYRFLVRVAQNVARAVATVHSIGNSSPQKIACVIGNLNHSGLLVAKDATVALIDADHFQYTINEKVYPYVFGTSEFTPPELHASRFKSASLTNMHTNFGLAVTIFHLLFMGRHPYAGRYTGPIHSLGDAIARNRFAYSAIRQYATQTIPPRGAMTLGLFPDAISDNFENAFGLKYDARPSAEDWITALSSFESSLSRCSDVTTHYYPNESKSCVWCKLKRNGSLDMFPVLSKEKCSPPNKMEVDSGSSSHKAEGTSVTPNPTLPPNKNVNELLEIRHDGAANDHRCPRCKKNNDSGALFCHSCGLPLNDRKNPNPATGGLGSDTNKIGPVRRLIGIVLYIAVIMLFIFAMLHFFIEFIRIVSK